MATGTVSNFLKKKGYGFIECREMRGDVFFHCSKLTGNLPEILDRGMEVEFEVGKQPDGRFFASNVRLKGGASADAGTGPAETGMRPGVPSTGYRFLNPYNFVRHPSKRRPEDHVLGDAPPPPHDRYVGLSGKIVCELEAVTPLFTADAHGTSARTPTAKGKEGHRSYRFLQADGSEWLSGSSLRGMVRQAFEAVTNSCFSVLDYETRLSYRLSPGDALGLVPARVKAREEKDGGEALELELLTGTTPLKTDGFRGVQYAGWVRCYQPIKRSWTQNKAPSDDPYIRRASLDPKDYKHGQPYYARMEQIQHPTKRTLEFWNVIELASERADLKPAGRGEKVYRGYLSLNNQNIDNKHDERFFFRDPANREGPLALPLKRKVIQKYNDLIKDYRTRHEAVLNERKEKAHVPDGEDPGLSRFITEREDLKPGDLLYARVIRSPSEASGYQIQFIAPVSIPRRFYDHKIADLFPEDLKSCLHKCRNGLSTALEKLCPACRLFGWVSGNPGSPPDKTLAPDVITAYRGRVSFSHARLEKKELLQSTPLVLAILSTPKPTTSRFYLLDGAGKPLQGKEDEPSGYDGENHGRLNQLRGRKFYRHHAKVDPREYRRTEKEASDQNRTLNGVLGRGSRFSFDVHFENLAKEELGGLLWSLELEKVPGDESMGWCHRFGLGRPLGFGSVRIRVKELLHFDPRKRYQADLTQTGIASILEHKEELIETFKTSLHTLYGIAFEDLPPVRDLKALLQEDQPALPVHYPRSSSEPQEGGKNFIWFVENKRSGKEPGPRYALPLAEEDDRGFPTLGKAEKRGTRGGRT